MLIRPCVSSDCPAVAALCHQLGYEVAVEEIGVRLELMREDQILLVAFDASIGSAVAWIEAHESTYVHSGRSFEISGLVVSSSARSQGIGARLVHAVEAIAAERGLPKIRVRSNIVRERAHSFLSTPGVSLRQDLVGFREGNRLAFLVN